MYHLTLDKVHEKHATWKAYRQTKSTEDYQKYASQRNKTTQVLRDAQYQHISQGQHHTEHQAGTPNIIQVHQVSTENKARGLVQKTPVSFYWTHFYQKRLKNSLKATRKC